MENNTITPKPEPQPQPVAPMPVFGSAVPAPTVTPEAAPAPTLSTSAMPAMSAQADPGAASAPASEPAQPASSGAAMPDMTAAAPLNTTPAMPHNAAPATPLNTAPAAAAESSPTSTPTAVAAAPVAQATPVAPTAPATPAATAASVTPSVAPAAAPAATPGAAPATPSALPNAAAPTATTAPAAPAVTANPAVSDTTVNPAAPASAAGAQPPINKGRLIALIAIIAGLLVAGIIAAVVIVLLTGQPNPAATASAALTNLESPDGAPTSIAGTVELVENDDVLASASAVLEDNNLFFSYDGVSDILESYLGLAAVADQDSISSLILISNLLAFAENTWWQIPVENLAIAAEYRAHPFLVLASANNNEYHLKIDGDKFADFLTALSAKVELGGETNCIDGPDDTNCGDSTGLSFLGMTSMPSVGEIKQAVSSVDILATIDAQGRIASLYTVVGEDDFVVNIKLDLVYAGASLSPDEYRPITELVSQFLRVIGY